MMSFCPFFTSFKGNCSKQKAWLERKWGLDFFCLFYFHWIYDGKIKFKKDRGKLSEISLELGKGGYEDQLNPYEEDLDWNRERQNEDGEPHRAVIRASAVISKMMECFTPQQLDLE